MKDKYDAIIIGGGPAGSTTGLVMARAGLKVCILEKETHPRFHIGESILPRNMQLLRSLGLESLLEELPHVVKLGAEFGFGNNPKTMRFTFADGLLSGTSIFNIERSIFDKKLIDKAKESGAEVFENCSVKSVTQLQHDSVVVETSNGTIGGRIIMDCSGHGTVIGRHLGRRRNFSDPELQKVAYFEHFENVQRLDGDESGHPSIFMSDEGWFWIIGLNETKTSIGFVTRPHLTKKLQVAPDRILRWAIERCPVVRHRMRNAVGPSTNRVLADFSYTCKPFAGDGYFLVGDAGCFLDPIFSTGVTLAMVAGENAAKLSTQLLRNEITPKSAQRAHNRFVMGSTSVFWRLIKNYYKHSFRELFMNGTGPLQVHRAVISTLAGEVFPRPVWALRWRLRFFDLCVWAQNYFNLVPRHHRFSLINESPVELPNLYCNQPG